MSDLVVVKHFDSIDQLTEEYTSLDFRHMVMRHYEIEHFSPSNTNRLMKYITLSENDASSPFGELHHKVNSVRSIKNFVELNDITVSRLLQYLDFSIDSTNVCRLLDPALLQYFNCNLGRIEGIIILYTSMPYLLSSGQMHSQLNFPERSLADSFA